jgi:hypothetical protein
MKILLINLNVYFPIHFDGVLTPSPLQRRWEIDQKRQLFVKKNSEREMANAMYLAGFDVKDVHMTDLISGRETLEDIQFIGAVEVSLTLILGSAKGWAGS